MANKIVIFGNSGSGKSTHARELEREGGLGYLDLDTLAWQKDAPTSRRPIADSLQDLESFMAANGTWVIEGCYSSLLGAAIRQCSQLRFLNPGADQCVENCRARPWEPHKYESPEEQDKNLAMLIEWVRSYDSRADEFSLQAHRQLYDSFDGVKIEYDSNTRDANAN
ncbi:MAG: shikimate kinase [Proteobacteria bacterium]|nr:shikimate kinase [Pseudomonadota bacterium]